MKILLAIDTSAYSDAAAAEVARCPWPPGSEIRIITVDTPLDPNLMRGGSSPAFDELVQRQRTAALDHLHATAAVVRQNTSGLTVTPILIEGYPKDVILDEAERWGADLVVVGSRGHGALRRFFLGSVSQAVATNAPCSVWIVRIPPASAPAVVRSGADTSRGA